MHGSGSLDRAIEQCQDRWRSVVIIYSEIGQHRVIFPSQFEGSGGR